MRGLSVVGAGEGVERAFHDVEVLARDCAYANCSHAGEEGCALAAALSDGRLPRGRLGAWLRSKAEPLPSDYESARRVVDDRKRRKATKTAEPQGRSSALAVLLRRPAGGVPLYLDNAGDLRVAPSRLYEASEAAQVEEAAGALRR